MKRKKIRYLWDAIKQKPYFWIWLLISLLWGILYIRYILGEYACFYTDIGGDTFDINYPLYSFFSRVFHGEGFESYSLNVGLGMDMSSYFYQYLNPVNLFVVLLPQKFLPWSVLFASYIKLLVIGIFGYKLFFKWIGNVWGSMASSILWTFSSYIMLWGQHFGFCTSIMMFTVFLYLVHLYISSDREWRYIGLLVPWITLMLFSNYYFLYMSGIFGALYVCVYMAFQKKNWKKIFLKLLGLGGMGFLGICIGGVCLIPTIRIFMDSTRTSAIGAGENMELFSPYSLRWIMGFLGRLFSNNTLGVGNQYVGEVNYYEIAMLFTSSLFFLGFPYLLLKKETRKKTLFLSILSVLMLLFPVTGKVLTMNEYNQRWSFILCMMEALVCGMFVKMLLQDRDKKKVWIAATAGMLFTVGGYFVLIIFKDKENIHVESIYILVFALFLAAYIIFVLFRRHSSLAERMFPKCLLGMICLEMAVVNYPTVNFRESPTRYQVAEEYYNDGSREAYQWISAEDSSVFRLAKEYESASQNDGMCQGYPGMSVYLSTNASELISLKEIYGGDGDGNNSVIFDNKNFLFQALLGMKYNLSMPGYPLSSALYNFMGERGGKDVYEYTKALPFGYFYDDKWEIDEIKEMGKLKRTYAALHGFYFTDEQSETAYGRASMEEMDQVSLMEKELMASGCNVERASGRITITNMGEDPNVVWENVGDIFAEGTAYLLSLKIDVEENTDMALYYKTDKAAAFNPYQLFTFEVSPKNKVWQCILPAGISDLRIDVSSAAEKVAIENICVGKSMEDEEAYEKLQSSSVKNTFFGQNIYYAEVDNTRQKTQMLCVPILYGEGFHAYIDGEEVELYNINGGLCGMEVPPGSYQVKLVYEPAFEKAGIGLSVLGLMVYVVMLACGRKRKHLRNKRL